MTRSRPTRLLLALLFGASSILAAQQPAPTAGQEELARGRLDGQVAAQAIGTGGWFIGGVASGVLTGLIGTTVIWIAAGSTDVSVPADRRLQIVNQTAVYQQAFESGYGEKLKAQRKRSALRGGLLGTAAFVVWYLASADATSDYAY